LTGSATFAAASGYSYSDASPLSFIARLRLALIWLLAFSGGFVLVEPAPYEFILILAIIVFAATGLAFRAAQVPLLLLLIGHNVGFVIGLLPVIELPDAVKWTAVSAMLSASTIFVAMVLGRDTERCLDILIKGYVASAIVTCTIAVLAFFKLMPGWENFILYLRARATFKDPNVFGPFLVLPGLIVIQWIVGGRARHAFAGAAVFLLIAAGLFLSFSRGAWGNFGSSAAVMLVLMAITARSLEDRLRIVVFSVVGTIAVAAIIFWLLSFGDVSSLFEDRAALLKDYDAGPSGRFGRHIQALLLIPITPFGLGPLQFSKFFIYEPHNSFLDPFMNGGWLAGVTWFALTITTLLMGLRHVFVRTPWQRSHIAVYATFVGQVGESYIIDVQHWRHYFLIMGIIWGLMTASRTGSAPPAPLPARNT
jgi:hypothetical protein